MVAGAAWLVASACGDPFTADGTGGGAASSTATTSTGAQPCNAEGDCEVLQPGTTCVSGACACPAAGETWCAKAGACVDTKTSIAHCGGCDAACVVGERATPACSGGLCVVGGCEEGFGDCDGKIDNGCELDVTSDRDHCGTCSITCAIECKGSLCNDVVSVGAGARYTCAVRGEGSVYCWGDNLWGNLGTGTSADVFASPTKIDLEGAKRVSASGGSGRTHTCALIEGGTAACWGANGNGQLGLGSADVSVLAPTQVELLSDVTDISAGGTHTCAVDSKKAYCWGGNDYGEVSEVLGDHPLPIEVSGLDDVVQVAAGASHSCARTGGGAVLCWGENVSGQLGNGNNGATATPQTVVGLDNAKWIAAGANHTCAVRGDSGEILCWGANDRGQLGVAAGLTSNVPVSTGVEGGSSLALGLLHSTAIVGTSLYVWGDNTSQQLGNGGPSSQSAPKPLVGEAFAEASAGDDHTCGILASGALYCWGTNTHGQVGNGTKADQPTPVPVVFP